MYECCAPVVASDDDRARARLLALLPEVRLVEALALVGSLELLSELVVTDTASVDDRVRRENVLCITSVEINSTKLTLAAYSSSTRSVLGSTSSNVGGLEVLNELLVPDDAVNR